MSASYIHTKQVYVPLKLARNLDVINLYTPPLLPDGRHWPNADVLLVDLLLPLLLFVVILKVIFTILSSLQILLFLLSDRYLMGNGLNAGLCDVGK